MRNSLLLSVTALGLFSLAACEFHAGTNDPPATPTTPAATAPAVATAAPAATPAVPEGPKTVMHTGGVKLPPSTPDAGT